MPNPHHSPQQRFTEKKPFLQSFTFLFVVPLFLAPIMSIKTSLFPCSRKNISHKERSTWALLSEPRLDLAFGRITESRFRFNHFRWLVGLTFGQGIFSALLYCSVQKFSDRIWELMYPFDDLAPQGNRPNSNNSAEHCKVIRSLYICGSWKTETCK